VPYNTNMKAKDRQRVGGTVWAKKGKRKKNSGPSPLVDTSVIGKKNEPKTRWWDQGGTLAQKPE